MRYWEQDQIERALVTQHAKNTRNETRIALEGTARPVYSFQGVRWYVTGMMSFWHHDAKVLAVDFDHDRVTDFGYLHYSHTTTSAINGWTWCLQSVFRFMGMGSLNPWCNPFDWTWSYAFNKAPKFRGQGWQEDMFDRFRKGVPWVKWIDGMPWYAGSHYVTRPWQEYETLRQDLLRDNGWRWWTGDWDASGKWVKRFIDANAERRWNALCKRRQRAAARQAQHDYTSE